MSSPSRAIHLLAKRGWISLAQLAILTGKSYQTVHERKRRGTLQTVQVNGINRIYMEELRNILTVGIYKDESLLSAIEAYIKNYEEGTISG